ncbi:MAG: OmpA family protein [Akkermansia sp.]|nr:OmpA family protein [Akkermansia sp.]
MKHAEFTDPEMHALPKIGNRRRRGYELARQRDITPIAMGAALGAGVLHLLFLYCAPVVFTLTGISLDDLKPKVHDEEIRVVVKRQEEPEMEENVPDAPPEDAPEPQEIVYEPAEIDLLDVQMDELDMAPGKTEIAVPKPVVTEDNSAADMEAMAPTQLDASAFHTEPLPPQELAVAEPMPVNANDVIAKADAQPEELAEATDTVERELRESAASHGQEMPADTRSLSELMGEEDPGSKSGVARLGADVLFGFNESKLRNSARITMLQLAALIQKNPQTYFLIEGHTDSLGGEDYNALLGLQRAAAVREWLLANNIPVQYVYIRSCACHQPLADVTLPKEQQELNRRVEIHMRKGGEEMPEGAVDKNYKVDLNSTVAAQLSRGVRAPQTAAVMLKEVAKPEPFVLKQTEAIIPEIPGSMPADAAKKPAASSAAKPAAKTTSKAGAAALRRMKNNAKKPAPKNGKKR